MRFKNNVNRNANAYLYKFEPSKFLQKIYFNLFKFFVYLFNNTFINFFKKHNSKLFMLLKSNKLPLGYFNILNKYASIFFMNIRIKKNIKILKTFELYRQRFFGNILIRNFWISLNSSNFKYFELNNKKDKRSIRNFYYISNILIKNNKNIVVLYYFFNKVFFSLLNVNYLPYYFIDNNKNLIIKNSKSKNLKIYLYLLFVNLNNQFKNSFNFSYIKVNFSTFRGVEAAFNYINNSALPKINSKKYTHKTLIKYEYMNFITNKIRINTYNFVNSIQTGQNNFIILNIFNNSANILKKKILSFTEFDKSTTKITWYNKIHNTTMNVTKNIVVFYLRASRHFNKGRYSRNRQLYRTGVYWCIWLNVVIVYALHYYFYRVVFAFGYLWLPLGIMILSIFSSRLYKYRYYDIKQLFIEFKEYNNFLFLLFLKFKFNFYAFIKNLVKFFNKFYEKFVIALKLNTIKIKNTIKELFL